MSKTKQKKTEARHIKWKEGGNDRHIHHAFANAGLNPFKAICGYHDGALSGGTRAKKCDNCKKMAGPYVEKAEARRIKAEAKWLASTTRKRLIDKVMKRVNVYSRGELDNLLDEMQNWEDWARDD